MLSINWIFLVKCLGIKSHNVSRALERLAPRLENTAASSPTPLVSPVNGTEGAYSINVVLIKFLFSH